MTARKVHAASEAAPDDAWAVQAAEAARAVKVAEAAAAAAPEDARALKGAAVARVCARRRAPEYRTAVGAGPLGRDMKVLVNGHLPEFLPPVTLAEWADDQASKLPLAAPYDTGVKIMAALRSGQAAGVAAVQLARPLKPWNAWCLFGYLSGPLPPQPPQAAEAPLRAVLAEWRRLGFVTTRAQAEREVIPVRTLNQDSLDASRDRLRNNAPPIPAGRL